MRLRPQRRRMLTVVLMARTQGTNEPHLRHTFTTYATSMHHAETLARERAAQQQLDVQ